VGGDTGGQITDAVAQGAEIVAQSSKKNDD
jgi:hypothetical protein